MDGTANTILSRTLAELIGTFFLVLGSVAPSMLAAGHGPDTGLLGAALAPGLMLIGGVTAFGPVSGAHFNPAVTVGLAAIGRFDWHDLPGYLVAQLVGALIAVMIARAWFGDVAALGATLPAAGVSGLTALAVEITLTFWLVFVIAALTGPDSGQLRTLAPLAVGLTVTFGILLGGSVSGAAMNPARWFAPALIGGTFDAGWVYSLGPLTGGALGALAYQSICARGKRQ
ncbi:MAG TPA: aquaporin [candidate division Zixibacteria bacterium]|nr:aquaporin [candidate division Zixibacteria bacterium]